VYFVTVCACHIEIKGYLLTYLLTYRWQYAAKCALVMLPAKRDTQFFEDEDAW